MKKLRSNYIVCKTETLCFCHFIQSHALFHFLKFGIKVVFNSLFANSLFALRSIKKTSTEKILQAIVGDSFGSMYTPHHLGHGGGNGGGSSGHPLYRGGKGGGAIAIQAQNNVEIDGVIDMSGGDGALSNDKTIGGGGGSGGSVHISCQTLKGWRIK